MENHSRYSIGDGWTYVGMLYFQTEISFLNIYVLKKIYIYQLVLIKDRRKRVTKTAASFYYCSIPPSSLLFSSLLFSLLFSLLPSPSCFFKWSSSRKISTARIFAPGIFCIWSPPVSISRAGIWVQLGETRLVSFDGRQGRGIWCLFDDFLSFAVPRLSVQLAIAGKRHERKACCLPVSRRTFNDMLCRFQVRPSRVRRSIPARIRSVCAQHYSGSTSEFLISPSNCNTNDFIGCSS